MNEQQFITSACIRASQAINTITQVAMKMNAKSSEDDADRREIIDNCSSVLFLLNHIGDLNRAIANPRGVSRFFNIGSDGKAIEVSREEYTGSLEDENLDDDGLDVV